MGFETGAGEFMQAGSYSAPQMRRSVFAWAARTSANVEGEIVGGLLSASDMQLSAASSGLVVNVSTGACLIPGTEATSQGGYHGFMESTGSVTLATANATNPRVDLICATSGDASYSLPTGGTSGAVTLQAVTGTPTSGATLTNLSGAQTLPKSSLLLGYVLVPAGATSLTNTDILNEARQVVAQFFQPPARGYRNAPTTISGLGWFVINLDTVNFDVLGAISGGAYVCKKAGDYSVSVTANVTVAAATNQVAAGIYQNATLASEGGNVKGYGMSSGDVIGGTCTDILSCAAGDSIKPTVYLVSSSSGTIYSNFMAVSPLC